MKSALVILGAAEGVGRGIVQAAVAADRPVIAVAHDDRELHALRSAYPNADVTALPGTVVDDASGAELAGALRELGRPLAGVVAVVSGTAEHGRLLDQPAAFLRRKLDEDLLPHLVAARNLVPLLAQANRGGTYVLIGSPGSSHPWAGHGYRSVASSALHMLARVLHDEALAQSVRLQLLSVDTPIRTDSNSSCACPQWPTALAIGEHALALIDHLHSNAPAHAIIRHRAADTADMPLRRRSDARMPAAQDPDSTATVLPARCLQDARTLLQALAPFKHKQGHPR